MNIERYVVCHKIEENKYFRNKKILLVNKEKNDNVKCNQTYYKTWLNDNIDNLNDYYCELTALYWIWKNINDSSTYISFEHYRRMFINKYHLFPNYKLLSIDFIEKTLKKYKIILPLCHNFKISVYEQYCKVHYKEDINLLKQIIYSLQPSYKADEEIVMGGHKITLYNMFIMKKEDLDKYCAFSFEILNKFYELKKDEITLRDSYQKRCIGFLSERLFNIWVRHNFLKKEIYYCPVGRMDLRKNMFKDSLCNLYNKLTLKEYDSH